MGNLLETYAHLIDANGRFSRPTVGSCRMCRMLDPRIVGEIDPQIPGRLTVTSRVGGSLAHLCLYFVEGSIIAEFIKHLANTCPEPDPKVNTLDLPGMGTVYLYGQEESTPQDIAILDLYPLEAELNDLADLVDQLHPPSPADPSLNIVSSGF